MVLGPGTLTVASKLGSNFEYRLLWILLLSTLLMIVFTTISAKFGFYKKVTLIRQIQIRFGRSISLLTGLSIFLVSVSFQSGNSVGSGLAMASITESPTVQWIVGLSLLAMFTLFFKSFYMILEKIMIVLVILMLFSFAITVLISKPDVGKLFAGLIPDVPKGSELLIVAMVATSCSIAGAFYQSYLVQQKDWRGASFVECRNESIVGITLMGLISMMVLVAAASVLHTNQIAVNSVGDMGRSLEPLFGRWSYILFTIGLFAASFSSLLGNATLGGSILADALQIGGDHRQLSTRLLIMIQIVIGSVIAIVFSEWRLKLIVYAQAFTILVVPLIALILLSITGDKSIMHRHRIKSGEKIAAALGIFLLTVLTVVYVWHMYLKP